MPTRYGYVYVHYAYALADEVTAVEPAEVDGPAPEATAVVTAAGKRASSERTPEPDDVAKRVKLDTVDKLDTVEPSTSTVAVQ